MSTANGHDAQTKIKAAALLKPLPRLESKGAEQKLDAGLRGLDHYRTKLPLWRYLPRQWLIPLVRWETPYLAAAQKAVRSSALDTFFSLIANLGTHTFFMITLPILFWCGYTHHGRAMVHMLASGVFFSGFVKDMWCLPRPLSPPLQRITMSKHVSLEYGFPSTHSANAVSVTIYAVSIMRAPGAVISPNVKLLFDIAFGAYALAIMLGRLYCGMHGFLDVVFGGALGALLAMLQICFGDSFDHFLHSGSLKAPLLVCLIILVLVRIHPEPADNCPCFDDSVAFAGVVIGLEFGNWHFGRTDFAWHDPVSATIPFELESLGWPRTIVRVVLGIIMVVAWREVMKPALLRSLPPLFRVIERLGMTLPRRFFVRATEYKRVPKELKDDELVPSISRIPSMLISIRHPRRRTSVSVGPQSEADAYETLAYREHRRRQSKSERTAASPSINEKQNGASDYFDIKPSASNTTFAPNQLRDAAYVPNSVISKAILDAETAVYTPLTPGSGANDLSRSSSQERRFKEQETREVFSQVEKPRVRYDVEVVTKLIVYAGIAWIATEGGPLVFEVLGLSVSRESS